MSAEHTLVQSVARGDGRLKFNNYVIPNDRLTDEEVDLLQAVHEMCQRPPPQKYTGDEIENFLGLLWRHKGCYTADRAATVEPGTVITRVCQAVELERFS